MPSARNGPKGSAVLRAGLARRPSSRRRPRRRAGSRRTARRHDRQVQPAEVQAEQRREAHVAFAHAAPAAEIDHAHDRQRDARAEQPSSRSVGLVDRRAPRWSAATTPSTIADVRDLARQALLVQVDPGRARRARHRGCSTPAVRRRRRTSGRTARTAPPSTSSMTIGSMPIGVPHCRHFPRSTSQLTTGTRSSGPSCSPHEPHATRRRHDRRATWHPIHDDRQERADHQTPSRRTPTTTRVVHHIHRTTSDRHSGPSGRLATMSNPDPMPRDACSRQPSTPVPPTSTSRLAARPRRVVTARWCRSRTCTVLDARRRRADGLLAARRAHRSSELAATTAGRLLVRRPRPRSLPCQRVQPAQLARARPARRAVPRAFARGARRAGRVHRRCSTGRTASCSSWARPARASRRPWRR